MASRVEGSASSAVAAVRGCQPESRCAISPDCCAHPPPKSTADGSTVQNGDTIAKFKRFLKAGSKIDDAAAVAFEPVYYTRNQTTALFTEIIDCIEENDDRRLH